MLSPRKLRLPLLLAAILMAASLPVQSKCDMNAHPDATACETDFAAIDQAPCTDSPDEDSHCGTGCTDCALPCCGGTAVVLCAGPSPAAATPIQAQVLPEALVRPQMDPDPLGHPPRV